MTTEDQIAWSRRRANRALREVSQAMLTGLRSDQRAIYQKWFPSPHGGRHAEVYRILTRTRESLEVAPTRFVPVVTASMGATDPDAEAHETALTIGAVAVAMVEVRGRPGVLRPPGSRYIALYPPWRSTPGYAASRLLHEAFHFHDPHRFGHTAAHRGFYNASRFQGFVSILANLGFRRLVVHARAMR